MWCKPVQSHTIKSFGGRMRIPLSALLLTLALGTFAVAQTTPAKAPTPKPSSAKESATTKPTVADAEKFIADTEAQLSDLSIKLARAQWVQSTFITDDTEALSADANDRLIAAQTKLAEDVKRFDGVKLPPVLARKFLLLKLQLFSLPDA